MKIFLFYFAIASWLAAITVHIFSLKGINLAEKMPLVWILHPGLFVVWIPAMISLNKNPELQKIRASRAESVLNPFSFCFPLTLLPKLIQLTSLNSSH